MRASAPHATALLRAMGVHVVMLTGDNRGSARRVAAHCGIAEADTHYGLTPERKMRFVTSETLSLETKWRADDGWAARARRRFHGRATLAMVGDGINDAPALGAADIGVAMGVAGAAAAMETADVALLTNDLARLAESVSLGRECVRKIRQNIAFSVAAKTLVLMLSLAGVTGLAVAVVADVGTALVVILNGMTVLRDDNAASHESREREKEGDEKNKNAATRKSAWFLSALGGRGRAALAGSGAADDFSAFRDAEAEGVCLLVAEEQRDARHDREDRDEVEMVETFGNGKERRALVACANVCCGGGGGSIAFGPFDASKLQSPMGSRLGSSASLSVLSGTSSP